MSSDARLAVQYRVANAEVRRYPFPHIVVENVFPPAFYAALRERLLPDRFYRPLVDTGRVGPGYSRARLSLFPDDVAAASGEDDARAFWSATFAAFLQAEFADTFLTLFQPVVEPRVAAEQARRPDQTVSVRAEMFLMRDLETYTLTPHTDAVSKLVSVLFYLPPDSANADLGTSIYLPKQRDFACAGGPHHPREGFDLVTTLPYVANTMVAFPRTDRSFHGVEPVRGEGRRRDILLFDLKMKWNTRPPSPGSVT